MGSCTTKLKMLLFNRERFELAHLKKKKERKKTDSGRFGSSWFGTFAMPFAVLGLVDYALKDEWYVVMKAYNFTVLRGFFGLPYIVLFVSLHIESTDSMNRVYGLYDS